MTKEEIRLAAEADLLTFIRLVAPSRFLGSCHEEVIRWWTRQEAKDHQLLLFPRDHMKSALVAFRVAWILTKDPTLRVLYISATSRLAEKQLGFIKQIFESDIHRRYWPDHIHPEEGKRKKWTQSEIELDHPLRAAEHIRDPSIMTAGLTTGITGMHFDVAVLDDVVVYENAYTQEGRSKVETQYSLLASIEGTGSQEWVVGTRYHPKDLYSLMLDMREPVFDDKGNQIGEESIYEVMEKAVENRGDGTGEFLWPRAQRKDGKWFGFDMRELARKKAKYIDNSQFRAQYYNDPSDPDSAPVDRNKFQYYERKFVRFEDGYVFFKDRRLNVYAAMDFAYSLGKRSDYTAIVVVGVDFEGNIYVLEIDRFKTERIIDYFENLMALASKWNFRKVRAEVTAAQKAIVVQLKELIKQQGLALSVDEGKPTSHTGKKEERIAAVLEPRYDNLSIWHYRGGNCQILEEELVMRYPPHDDVKDALASAIEICVRPTRSAVHQRQDNIVWSGKFRAGGRR
jgi:hypothetical protein